MGAVFLDQIIPIVQRGAAEAGRRRVDLLQSRHDALLIVFPSPCGEGQGWGSRGFAQMSTSRSYLPTPHPTLPHKGGRARGGGLIKRNRNTRSAPRCTA